MESPGLWNSPQYAYQLDIRYEPFYLQYTLDKEHVKLPKMFNKDQFSGIADSVLLCDPVGNMFQVMVEKKGQKIYFGKGWNTVGRFYGLHLGGWVRLVIARNDRFLIKLRNRLDHEVIYPIPPQITWIGEGPKCLPCSGSEVVVNYYANVCQRPDFFHVLEKNLTFEDVYSDMLHLPIEFCQTAFLEYGEQVMLYDEWGLQTACLLTYNCNTMESCGLTKGWHSFCLIKGLAEGVRFQLAVPSTNTRMMCFRLLVK